MALLFFKKKSDRTLPIQKLLEPWRCRLLTTVVALPRGRHLNAIDRNTIPTPLAASPTRFGRCRLLRLRQNVIVSRYGVVE